MLMFWIKSQKLPNIPLTGSDLEAYINCDKFDDLPQIWLKVAITLFGPVDGPLLLGSMADMIRSRKADDQWRSAVQAAVELLEEAYRQELSRVTDVLNMKLEEQS